MKSTIPPQETNLQMPARFNKVVLLNNAEALQFAFALTSNDYNHRNPLIEDDYNLIFFDTREREYFFTNAEGMQVVELIIKAKFNCKINNTNL